VIATVVTAGAAMLMVGVGTIGEAVGSIVLIAVGGIAVGGMVVGTAPETVGVGEPVGTTAGVGLTEA
jgi:hypothetical protein